MALATNDQAAQRQPQIFTDQHGREWYAETENKTRHPVGKVTPVGWDAPVLPDQHFFRFEKNRPGQLLIDYDTMIRHLADVNRDYTRRLLEVGTTMYAEKFDLDAPLTPQLRDVIGNPPLKTELAIAMYQGNPYALGLTDTPDVRLEPMVKQWKPDLQKPDYMTSVDFSQLVTDPSQVQEAPKRSMSPGSAAAIARELQLNRVTPETDMARVDADDSIEEIQAKFEANVKRNKDALDKDLETALPKNAKGKGVNRAELQEA